MIKNVNSTKSSNYAKRLLAIESKSCDFISNDLHASLHNVSKRRTKELQEAQ